MSVKLMPSRSPVKPAAPVVVKAHTTDLRQTKGAGDGKQVRAPQPQTQEVPQKGFIATLKDSYGFIETALHDKEVFFHFRFASKPRNCIRNRFTLAIFLHCVLLQNSSNFEGDANELELADEVEFYLTKKTNKVSAEMIRRLPRGSVAPEVRSVPFERQNTFYRSLLIKCV